MAAKFFFSHLVQQKVLKETFYARLSMALWCKRKYMYKICLINDPLGQTNSSKHYFYVKFFLFCEF